MDHKSGLNTQYGVIFAYGGEITNTHNINWLLREHQTWKHRTSVREPNQSKTTGFLRKNKIELKCSRTTPFLLIFVRYFYIWVSSRSHYLPNGEGLCDFLEKCGCYEPRCEPISFNSRPTAFEPLHEFYHEKLSAWSHLWNADSNMMIRCIGFELLLQMLMCDNRWISSYFFWLLNVLLPVFEAEKRKTIGEKRSEGAFLRWPNGNIARNPYHICHNNRIKHFKWNTGLHISSIK